MNPLEILPEEMWGCVLGKLDSSDDLLSAHNTCQLWRSLLGKRRTTWMFQGVLPTMAKHLPKSDILNCRQVCKGWKKGVDSFLEIHQQSRNAADRIFATNSRKRPHTLEVDLNANAKRLKMTTTDTIKKFQADFSASEVIASKNPFVSRSLKLDITKLNVTVLKFFERFGAHLLSLDLDIFQLQESEITSPVKIVQFIWNILGLVPNLRRLSILTMQKADCLLDEETEPEKLEMEQFFRINSAPPLPQLNNLKVDGNIPMMNQVLETAYAPQLKKYVHISRQEFAPSNLTNLQELTWYFGSDYLCNNLNKMLNLGCQSLQRLDVHILNSGSQKHDVVPVQQLFETIEVFDSSLTHLYIFWGHFKLNHPVQLNLPLVQELCLEIGSCKDSADINLSFLQNLTSLRKLKCVFWNPCYTQVLKLSDCEHKQDDAVDLHYYLSASKHEGPYKSNIWRVLQSLDEIQIQVAAEMHPHTVTQTNIYTRLEKNRMCIE